MEKIVPPDYVEAIQQLFDEAITKAQAASSACL